MANLTEPTVTECNEIKNVGDALVWAGFPLTDVANGTNAVGSLIVALGQPPGSSLRELVALDPIELAIELELSPFDGQRHDLTNRENAKLAKNVAKEITQELNNTKVRSTI